ncbi:MAG: hypothetical protein ABIG37_01185 [Nanoarchaeota archaeon]|nr:hypothetical protein [Nanoarchaeota archaeon]
MKTIGFDFEYIKSPLEIYFENSLKKEGYVLGSFEPILIDEKWKKDEIVFELKEIKESPLIFRILEIDRLHGFEAGYGRWIKSSFLEGIFEHEVRKKDAIKWISEPSKYSEVIYIDFLCEYLKTQERVGITLNYENNKMSGFNIDFNEKMIDVFTGLLKQQFGLSLMTKDATQEKITELYNSGKINLEGIVKMMLLGYKATKPD